VTSLRQDDGKIGGRSGLALVGHGRCDHNRLYLSVDARKEQVGAQRFVGFDDRGISSQSYELAASILLGWNKRDVAERHQTGALPKDIITANRLVQIVEEESEAQPNEKATQNPDTDEQERPGEYRPSR